MEPGSIEVDGSPDEGAADSSDDEPRRTGPCDEAPGGDRVDISAPPAVFCRICLRLRDPWAVFARAGADGSSLRSRPRPNRVALRPNGCKRTDDWSRLQRDCLSDRMDSLRPRGRIWGRRAYRGARSVPSGCGAGSDPGTSRRPRVYWGRLSGGTQRAKGPLRNPTQVRPSHRPFFKRMVPPGPRMVPPGPDVCSDVRVSAVESSGRQPGSRWS